MPTREVLEARGRLAWALGVQKGRAGDFAGAIATYRSAREAYERLGDQESALWLRFLGGEAQGYLGLAAEGSRERRLAIDRLAELGAHDRVATGLVGSAILELLEERPQRAAELLGRALAAADMAGRPPYRVAVAHLWRSRLRFELGDEQGAREDLSRAHTWATRCPPEDRRELSGHLEMADGLLAQSHSAAIDSLSRAHSAFASNGRAVWLPAVLIERGRALRLAGDVAAADADLRRGRLLLAEQRRLVGERPDSALRTVQLRLLREANPDLRSTAAWAAFATLGG